ncbi:predicted protein [Pyrenophora tritici-repentis Pt-1C-BFP]|uniref:Uncharacterized protein n=1 Tax=Pyrenophora tritici-repentis (strain Pt-1C-BFP) TaxID=426418 RepID=B2WPY9_PYRTR|nr:uncharacterized protein PTRG_12057 [Pyrenophora tritici-repentis Pt-1C-BFP]EDU46205.1 predicted protein [Pyrenophora tritici-repentis Pt-1C-BFP]
MLLDEYLTKDKFLKRVFSTPARHPHDTTSYFIYKTNLHPEFDPWGCSKLTETEIGSWQ